MSDPVNDFLMSAGGGAPSASFPTIGTVWKGTILKSEIRQQSEPDGTLKTWPDGNPMMQVVVTIQTDERNLDIEDDNGARRVFVKGQMQEAVKDAVLAAGCQRLDVGGTLAVAYVADGIPKQKGFSAPKQYRAEYRAPAVGVGALLGDSPAAPPATPPASPPAQPAPQPAPVAAPAAPAPQPVTGSLI